MWMRAAGAAAGALLALAACSSAEQPDESGLTAVEKRALVDRYYACARAADQRCVRDTLHPEFVATDHPAGPMTRAVHAETMVLELRKSRVEARIMPHEASDVWVVELWIDKHGASHSRLRAFSFEDRLIRSKTALGG